MSILLDPNWHWCMTHGYHRSHGPGGCPYCHVPAPPPWRPRCPYCCGHVAPWARYCGRCWPYEPRKACPGPNWGPLSVRDAVVKAREAL